MMNMKKILNYCQCSLVSNIIFKPNILAKKEEKKSKVISELKCEMIPEEEEEVKKPLHKKINTNYLKNKEFLQIQERKKIAMLINNTSESQSTNEITNDSIRERIKLLSARNAGKGLKVNFLESIPSRRPNSNNIFVNGGILKKNDKKKTLRIDCDYLEKFNENNYCHTLGNRRSIASFSNKFQNVNMKKRNELVRIIKRYAD